MDLLRLVTKKSNAIVKQIESNINFANHTFESNTECLYLEPTKWRIRVITNISVSAS